MAKEFFDLASAGVISWLSGASTEFSIEPELLQELSILCETPPGDFSLYRVVTAETTEQLQGEFARLMNNEDYRGLESLLERITTSSEYLQAIARRNDLKKAVDSIGSQLEAARKASKLVNRKVAAAAELQIRELSLSFREQHEELSVVKAGLDDYRLLAAQVAKAASVLRAFAERKAGVFEEFTGDSLGSLKTLGDYPQDSPEWHASRARGIGGSDVGSIMRVDPIWGYQNLTKVTSAKLGIPLPDDAARDGRSAIGRGHAWEDTIRNLFAQKHPELRVAFCKSSWYSTEKEYRHANFDGLILGDETPEGILEIKTGSDASKWGAVELGLAGVPGVYRKQVLWYAANAGLSYGVIVAVIDDNDYREYWFSMDDPGIQEEVASMFRETDTYWEGLAEKRRKLAAGEPLVKKRSRGMKMLDYDAVASVFAGYAGISQNDAKLRLETAVEAKKVEKGRWLSDSEFHRAAVEVFATHDPRTRTKPLVGVDIETTTTSPRSGRIIETGIVELKPDGTTEVLYSSLHGLPEKAAAGVGVGAVDIHKIDLSMLVGKKPFHDPETQTTILKLLRSVTLVAHNAGFEDRFFEVNLPGYLEAKARGEITLLDTRKLASFIMQNADNSTLQAFTEDNGVPYEGAHAATQDAAMMMQALGRMQRFMFKHKTFRTKRPTEAARMKVLKTLQNAAAER